MSFNFIDDTFTIIHNGKNTKKLSLNGYKSITPAFSFSSKGEEIEITKYEFL